MRTLFFATFWLLALSIMGRTQMIDIPTQSRGSMPAARGGFVIVTSRPGADLAAKVANAFASFGAGKCGTGIVPSGTYTYSSGPIFIPTGCWLEGTGNGMGVGASSGVQLIYAGPPATSAVVLGADSSYAAGDDSGIRNLKITTSASSTCPSNGMLRWNPTAGGANKWNCGVLAANQTVTGATNASPISVTVAAHGYSNGSQVFLHDVQGNQRANGEWTITFVDANTFTLNGSTGNGAFITGVGQTASAQLVTYSAAIPHLAAIQDGAIDPTVSASGTHHVMEHISIDGSGGDSNGVGKFHLGVYWNGCEECIGTDVAVNGADDGFYIGVMTNASTLIQPSAQFNRHAGIHVRGFNAITIYSPLIQSNQWIGHGVTSDLGFGLLLDNENAYGLPQARVYAAYYEGNWHDMRLGDASTVATGDFEAVGTKVNRGNIPNDVQGYVGDLILRGCTIQSGPNLHVFSGTALTHDCNIVSGVIDNSQGSARVYQMVDGRLVYADNGIGGIFAWAQDGSPATPMTFSATTNAGAQGLALQNLTAATVGNQSLPSAREVFSGNGWASGPAASQRLNFGISANSQGGTSVVGGSLQITAKANASDLGDLGSAVFRMFPDGSFGRIVTNFSSLPTCDSGHEGVLASVNDAMTNAWGDTITGSGGDHVLGYCDGTNWTVIGK